MTKDEQLLGNLFREALYTNDELPQMIEVFAKSIFANFPPQNFLLLQMASQLLASAQIREEDSEYRHMISAVSSVAFENVGRYHPTLHYFTEQRFKSFYSELFKRYEKVQKGVSPEIKDLFGITIVLEHNEPVDSQEHLKTCYEIAQQTMENFSILNSVEEFPLSVNLSMPDKTVQKSAFNPGEHPSIVVADDTIRISGLANLGKDYIYYPKKDGYQAYQFSNEIWLKNNPKVRNFAEVQVKTINQYIYANYGPASHNKYKNLRNEKMQEIFSFDKDKVHLVGYHPNVNCSGDFEKDFDTSGFVTPKNITRQPNY